MEYIAWRYQDGHDREMTEKASRKMTDEEKAQMEDADQVDHGRVAQGRVHRGSSEAQEVVPVRDQVGRVRAQEQLVDPARAPARVGLQQARAAVDDFEASREGAGSREISVKLIRQHLEAVGLQGEIAQHHAVGGYSGGQKVKVVLAAAMWNNPQVLVLDEPTKLPSTVTRSVDWRPPSATGRVPW